ncbi:MAG: hypothetical protein QOI98_864 [Solirubrobacteraceae bacterium]|nr:hypothetical protein [Solirubrobacteraceae bacterium]
MGFLRRQSRDVSHESAPEQPVAAPAQVAGPSATPVRPVESQVVASFLARADGLGEQTRPRLDAVRTRLAHIETAQTDERRAAMCVDWLVREHAPAWLELAGLGRRARALRRLAPLQEVASIDDAVEALTRAQREAAAIAAREAAWDATWADRWEGATSAARDAAWDAAAGPAWDAARDGARFVDWSPLRTALGDAAWDAARAASWDAAWEAGDQGPEEAARVALAATAEELELSALDLLARLLDPKLDATA